MAFKKTTAMEAYRFYEGGPDTGEYVLLDQELKVDNIKVRKGRQ